jgi:hypothetical protein
MMARANMDQTPLLVFLTNIQQDRLFNFFMVHIDLQNRIHYL